MDQPQSLDAAFVKQRLRLTEVPAFPGVSLYLAHAGSRLGGLGGDEGVPPYWAYVWGGGLVLAAHIYAHPECVAGRRVLDFGAGSGLVGVCAARSGAATVAVLEADGLAEAALTLNAVANGVALDVTIGNLVEGALRGIDLVLAGDVFYSAEVADRSAEVFTRCVAAGIEVLVGDPGRRFLPRDRLEQIATYRVPDFGQPLGPDTAPSGVYRFLG